MYDIMAFSPSGGVYTQLLRFAAKIMAASVE